MTVESEASTVLPIVGWADVQASATGALAGFSIFRLRQIGVPDSEGSTVLDTRAVSSVILSYDNSNGFQTGLAIANQGPASTVMMTIRDESGAILGSLQIPVATSGHTAFMLTSQFIQAANRRGTVEFQNTSGNITGVSIRFSPALSFISLPIVR